MHGRQTEATRRASKNNHGGGLCCLFQPYFGSPTTFVKTPVTPKSRWGSRVRATAAQISKSSTSARRADGFAGGRHPAPRFHWRRSRWGDNPRQATQPRPPGSDPRGRCCLPTSFVITAIPIDRTDRWLSYRHACLPRASSIANSCTCASSSPTSEPTTISRS